MVAEKPEETLGACVDQLMTVYLQQIRRVLEMACPEWHPVLTIQESRSIERIIKNSSGHYQRPITQHICVGFPRTGLYPDIGHFFENFNNALHRNLTL